MPPTIVVVAAVIESDGRYLLTRRLAGTHLEGLWEFPGGKCEPGEALDNCLKRELREELDVEADVADEILQIAHDYPERTVELHFFRCALRGMPRARLGQEMRWAPPVELRELDLPPADAALINLLTPL